MKRLFVITVTLFTLIGCTNSSIYSGEVYTADQAKRAQMVSYGTVISARPIQLQANDDKGILGSLGGAVIGGFLGNTIGGGSGKNLGIAAGTIAGAVAGQATENKLSRVEAVELEIQQENGSTIVVIQKDDPKKFYVGQAVRLVSDGKKINVGPR